VLILKQALFMDGIEQRASALELCYHLRSGGLMNSRWLAYVLVLFGSVSLGYACKGDGGGGTFLQVIETSPVDNQAEVPIETRIGFRINAPIDPDWLTTETFFLTDGDGTIVPSTVMVGDEADVAELIPDQPLAVITDFTVTVTTGLQSPGGATLEKDFEWDFRTLDSAWGTPGWLEEVGTGVSDQHEIVVDGQSNALAVWEYTEDTGSGIWANHYTRAGLWEQPELISSGDMATTPQVAADDAGNGFAVWAQSEGSTSTNIWTNRYVVDQGWGIPELLQDGEVTPARLPSIVADPAGNAIAIWAQQDIDASAVEVVWARRFEPGVGWGAAESIDEMPSALVGRAGLGMDRSGNAIAVWSRGTSLLWANRYTAGSGWGTAELIKDDTSPPVRDQRLAVGANGEAVVIWVQDDPDFENIWGVRYAPGSNWGDPERIDEYADGDKKQPDVAVDGAGVAHAVWSQDDPDFENIWASQYGPSSGWGTPVLIEPANDEPNEDAHATVPRVGVNTDGNTFVVWRQLSEGWGSIWSNRIDPGEAWDPARTQLIENDDRAAKRPKIAVDENRHAHAIWLRNVATSIDWVRTNRFE
jgi:hypothetical protein